MHSLCSVSFSHFRLSFMHLLKTYVLLHLTTKLPFLLFKISSCKIFLFVLEFLNILLKYDLKGHWRSHKVTSRYETSFFWILFVSIFLLRRITLWNLDFRYCGKFWACFRKLEISKTNFILISLKTHKLLVHVSFKLC